jgi:microcystin-dependent protein
MKTKLLSLLMLLAVATTFAQITTSPAGIAVQGIARDDNNTARVSKTIKLTFDFYYVVNNVNMSIYKAPQDVATDAFGVFSTVLKPVAANNILIANNDTFLKISEGETVISDERLRQVPYAIAASNGVPTGAIMPYIGTTAPAGWALCDGATLPSTATALIALVGNNAPNLGGMFLRGAGGNKNTNMGANNGPDLMEIQGDLLKSHDHDKGTLLTNETGNHNHHATKEGNVYSRYVLNNGQGTVVSFDPQQQPGNEFNLQNSAVSIDNGNHSHTITGNTGVNGGAETRPVNYGVNYIIKL